MSLGISKQPLKMASLEAKIIRADGTVEDLGTIAYYHRNPFKQGWWNLRDGYRTAWRNLAKRYRQLVN